MDDAEERNLYEMMRTQAKMSRVFYDALLEQKFNPLEALTLTRTWLASFNQRPPEGK